KAYFQEVMDRSLAAMVKTYLVDGWGDKYGALEGAFKVHSGGDTGPWQGDFLLIVLGTLAVRGSEDALALMKWAANFYAGLFLHADDGYNPLAGSAYYLQIEDPVTHEPFTTWAEMYDYLAAQKGDPSSLTYNYVAGYGDHARGA